MTNAVLITVAICTYNRDRFIVACLQALARQTLPPHRFEVLIIDNASTDLTATYATQFIQAHPDLPFRYLYEPSKGLAHARNRGIQEAAGEVILYIDDDAEAQPDLLAVYAHFFDNHPQAAGAGGRILPAFTEAPRPAWISRWLDGYLARMDPGGSTRLFAGRMKYPFGCNMAYRKQWLLKVGMFPVQLAFRGDDKHIYHAVKKLNPNIYFVAEAVVHHNIPANRLQYAYFKTLFLKTGNEEKIRLQQHGGRASLLSKLVEYGMKLGVAGAIWLGYALTGYELKGRYVLLSQWFTLLGFLKTEVKVR